MKKYSSDELLDKENSMLEEPEVAYTSSRSMDTGMYLSENILKEIIDTDRMACDHSKAITAEELLSRIAPKIKAMF